MPKQNSQIRAGIFPRKRCARLGVTMLEIIIASTLLTTVVTTVAAVMRGAYSAWQAHVDDYTRVESAQATLRHMVRSLRQCTAVTAITASNNTAGSLSATTTAGQTYVWSRNSGTNQVSFGIGSATDLLAENITELSFVGYKSDGTTATTTVSDIHSVKCTAKVQLSHDSTITRTLTCWAWVRAW